MPHVIVDYSANMEEYTDMAQFCDVLRQAAVASGLFQMAGVRVRAFRADHVSIADGDAMHGYIDVSVRLRGGRPLDVRQAATAQIFEAARAFLEPVIAEKSVALSMEMRDIDPELAPKLSTYRDHLPGDV